MTLSNNYTITVDIKRNIAMASQTPIFVSNDSAFLYIKVLEEGKPFDYAGADRITVSFRRPDKTNVQGLAEYDAETGMVKYQLGTQEMEINGVIETAVQIYLGTSRISTRPFSVKITKDYEEAIESQKDLTLLQSLFIEVDQVKTDTIKAKDNANSAADYARGIRDNFGHKGTYNPLTTYKEGNVVSYGGVNYFCTLEATGVVPTNSAYWNVVAPQATYRDQYWTAVAGQKTFNLTNGSYGVGGGNIQITVGGVIQTRGVNYEESSETSITFFEAVPEGLTVYASWNEGTLSIINRTAVSTNITSIPQFVGQIAVVGTVGYLAVDTSSTSDWKQITN